jgi:hypothetical protein
MKASRVKKFLFATRLLAMDDSQPLQAIETRTTDNGDILKTTNIASIKPEPKPKETTSYTKPVMALFILLMVAASFFFPGTPKPNTTKKPTAFQGAKAPKP